MIGNDIVDWAQASRESNWQRRGFLDKLFTPAEQQLIHEADHPERMVWILWSLKESVYKAALRQTGKRQFAPQKIHCHFQPTPGNSIEGTAVYDSTYRIKASLTQDYVSSIAVLSSIPFSIQESVVVFKNIDYAHQHTQLRQFVLNYCETKLAFPSGTTTIQKDNKNIPFLVIDTSATTALRLPLSLSHHGHYGSFIIGR